VPGHWDLADAEDAVQEAFARASIRWAHHLFELPVGQVAGELGLPTGTEEGRLWRGWWVLAAQLGPMVEEVKTNDG
jgi:hypothetical protein